MNQALEFVRTSAPEQLRALTPNTLMVIAMTLTPEELGEFLFAKNLKIFGGINNYINDVFNKQTIERIHQMPSGQQKNNAKEGVRHLFNKMLTYPDVTQFNINRINKALSTVLISAAAAAGGKYEPLAYKLCGCIKKVKKTYKNTNEKRAIPICVKSVLQTRGKTLKKFSCRNGPKLETQPWPKK